MKSTMAATLSVVLLASPAAALTESQYNQRIAEINAKYQPRYEAAAKEGEDIQDESGTCIAEGTFDADWEETKVSFDRPVVIINMREMKFDILKTKVTQKVVAKTKVPKTYFKRRGPVKIPEFRWETTEITVPVTEFKWETTTIKTNIPETRMVREEWKFHILKIKKLKEASIPCEDEKRRAEKLEKDTEATANAHQSEITAVTHQFLTTQADQMKLEIVRAESTFDVGIKSANDAIASALAGGASDTDQKRLVEVRDNLISDKKRTLAEMQTAHDQILQSAKPLS